MLQLIKSNHARPGQPMMLEWSEEGVLVAADKPGALSQRIRRRQLERLIFEKVQEGWDRDAPYSSRPQMADQYLPGVISRTTEFKHPEIKAALQSWIDSGHIVTDQKTTRSPRGLRIAKQPEFTTND